MHCTLEFFPELCFTWQSLMLKKIRTWKNDRLTIERCHWESIFLTKSTFSFFSSVFLYINTFDKYIKRRFWDCIYLSWLENIYVSSWKQLEFYSSYLPLTLTTALTLRSVDSYLYCFPGSNELALSGTLQRMCWSKGLSVIKLVNRNTCLFLNKHM